MHARHKHMSESAEHHAHTMNDMQGTGAHAHMQHTTQTQAAKEQNEANSSHSPRRAALPEPSTPTQTAPRPSSPEDQGMPEVDVNVRYGRHQLSVPLITDPVHAECSTSTSGPATAARNREEQVQRTTTTQSPTGELERSQNPSQHTDYVDH